MSLNVYVILGQRHGSDEIEQIGKPIHANDAREAFMPYRANSTHPVYQRVWLGRVEVERDVRRLERPGVENQPAPVVPEPPAEPTAESNSPDQPSASEKKKRK
jgi:hypothetical protein